MKRLTSNIMSDQAATDSELYRLNEIFKALYKELHSMAHAQLQQGNAALNTTVLVHELYLRLAQANAVPVGDPRHFLAYASNAMRFAIVDIIRAQRAEKRGGGRSPVTLNTGIANQVHAAEEVLRIHEALVDLSAVDPALVQLVEMRYFAGLSETEIGDAMQMSTRSVRRNWKKALLLLRAGMA